MHDKATQGKALPFILDFMEYCHGAMAASTSGVPKDIDCADYDP